MHRADLGFLEIVGCGVVVGMFYSVYSLLRYRSFLWWLARRVRKKYFTGRVSDSPFSGNVLG